MRGFAVELVEVTKRFAGATPGAAEEVAAVNDVSLQIGYGEFFSLLGPSGCGKSTSLRIIAGFEQPTSGAVLLEGRDVSHVPANRRNVNMVFQNYALFPHLSVAGNVAFGLQMKKLPKAEIARRVAEALEMVRLPGLGGRKPRQLSGGQQQRVALARALVNHPAVLLLDEPLGALDQKLRQAMQLELKRLQREVGITFIYVTHDQEEALTMSDRIAVMNLGRVVQLDSPQALYERPGSRFAADFIGLTNFIPGRVAAVEAGEMVVEVDRLGRLRAPKSAGVTLGQRVTLAVRPERINLAAAGANADGNWLEGRVQDVIFFGSDTQHLVALANGAQIIVREQNRAPLQRRPQPTAGDLVRVNWDVESTAVLVD